MHTRTTHSHAHTYHSLTCTHVPLTHMHTRTTHSHAPRTTHSHAHTYHSPTCTHVPLTHMHTRTTHSHAHTYHSLTCTHVPLTHMHTRTTHSHAHTYHSLTCTHVPLTLMHTPTHTFLSQSCNCGPTSAWHLPQGVLPPHGDGSGVCSPGVVDLVHWEKRRISIVLLRHPYTGLCTSPGKPSMFVSTAARCSLVPRPLLTWPGNEVTLSDKP